MRLNNNMLLHKVALPAPQYNEAKVNSFHVSSTSKSWQFSIYKQFLWYVAFLQFRTIAFITAI